MTERAAASEVLLPTVISSATPLAALGEQVLDGGAGAPRVVDQHRVGPRTGRWTVEERLESSGADKKVRSSATTI